MQLYIAFIQNKKLININNIINYNNKINNNNNIKMSRMKILSANIFGSNYENGQEVIKKINLECVICKRNLCEPSYETITDNKKIFRDTDIAIGKCGHLFHSDCIDEWIKRCDKCPIDNVKWCFHREIDSTTRLVIDNKYNNSNKNKNKNNNVNHDYIKRKFENVREEAKKN